MKTCECGCGQPAPIATYSLKARGWVKGQPKRFISGHNSRGEGNPNWAGGRNDDGRGYIRVRLAPGAWAYEHRLIAETMIGRPLRQEEVVHHIDGDKSNNKPENLRVFDSQGAHVRAERTGGSLGEAHRAAISDGLKVMWTEERRPRTWKQKQKAGEVL